MNQWLTAMAAGPAVLVTVAAVEGSAPREPGAHMLVGSTRAEGTIGGGHLELRAIEIARGMLAEGRERHLERFALGPTLGQCCGGVVQLAFERTDAEHAREVTPACWRLVALDGPPARLVIPAQAGTPALRAEWERLATSVIPAQAGTPAHRAEWERLATSVIPAQAGTPALRAEWERIAPEVPASAGMTERAPEVSASARTTCLLTGPDGRRWLADLIEPPRAHLVLFGAGHVGAALVRALAPLPCTVTWVDEREDLFPADIPGNVRIEATDTPEAAVAEAPGGAAFLVMTHSHALDQRLTEAILARPDVGWFGLIGSKTKRKQFEHRLRARGVDEARLAAMACPIGMPGITSKLPAVIAASVAAQLLAVWEAQAHASAAPPIRLAAGARS